MRLIRFELEDINFSVFCAVIPDISNLSMDARWKTLILIRLLAKSYSGSYWNEYQGTNRYGIVFSLGRIEYCVGLPLS